MKQLLLFGAGGHAREVLATVSAINEVQPRYQILGFVDDRLNGRGESRYGFPMLGRLEDLVPESLPEAEVIVGSGSPASRGRIAARLEEAGLQSPLLIHPRAVLGPVVTFSRGTLVAPMALLTTNIKVGKHVIINSSATVSHDGCLADFVTIGPGSRIAGGVTLEEGADIGIGATILPGVTVGAWSIVGGGAVVHRDVPENSTVVGVPARVIKTHRKGWHLQ